MRRLIQLSVLLLVPSFAFAQNVKKQLNAATDAVEDARSRARRSNNFRCREALTNPLDTVTDKIDGLRKHAHPQEINQVKEELVNFAAVAAVSRCPIEVSDNLQRAIDLLEEARAIAWRNRGQDRHDDGDDNRPETAFVQVSPLKVTTNSVFDGEPAVRVQVPQLQMFGMQGQRFYLAARFRSYEGEWSEWVSTQQWTVPSDPFSWANAFNHFFRYSTLAEDDFSDGRYVAHIGVFDSSGRELGFREATFKVRVPQLPPVVVQPPPYVPPARDCGTDNDPGCSMTRDGQLPMDGPTFLGFLRSMRSNPNEMLRVDIGRTMFQRNYATAAQLSLILDLFNNEMFRLDIGKTSASKLVNPQHAVGLASKFRNAMFGREFTEVMARQQPGQVAVQQPPPLQPPPLQPPPVGQRTPPPPVAPGPQPGSVPPGYVQPGYVQPGYVAPGTVPVQPAYRDCGTGDDPGCTMARGGQFAMDAPTFRGVLQALRANPNELTRADMCRNFFAANFLTANQLGMVFDLFNNELTRLEVAKLAAPHVVNPMHAVGLASRWRNSITAQEYTQVMSSQR